jgi:hypothetical protein
MKLLGRKRLAIRTRAEMRAINRAAAALAITFAVAAAFAAFR